MYITVHPVFHIHFLPHFHYNKDWNFGLSANGVDARAHFLPHFHYNKDWNLRNGLLLFYEIKLLTPLPL